MVPLYISILFHVMKEQGTHEGCIEQMDRLLRKKLFASPIPVDEENRIRMDDWEMVPGFKAPSIRFGIRLRMKI